MGYTPLGGGHATVGFDRNSPLNSPTRRGGTPFPPQAKGGERLATNLPKPADKQFSGKGGDRWGGKKILGEAGQKLEMASPGEEAQTLWDSFSQLESQGGQEEGGQPWEPRSRQQAWRPPWT